MIKEGQTPEAWEEQPAKLRQKDVDAHWTKKNSVVHDGYKNRVCANVTHKLIRNWAMTGAAVHDSNIFEEPIDEDNTCRAVWADSAYRSETTMKTLEQ